MKNTILWLWFTKVFGLSNVSNNMILNFFGSPEKILSASKESIQGFERFTPSQKAASLSPDFSFAKAELLKCQQQNISIITLDDSDYPKNLRDLKNPPFLLYCIGDKRVLNENYPISMVGTRSPDEYGELTARTISSELSSLGALVVSGLALGCDSNCHEGAILAGGKTLGIAACGLDVNYPQKNSALRESIIKNGAIISEFSLGTPALPTNFSIRNRLISGISLATIIIQCTLKSGTMLTASHALSQDKDIYAVTGNVFSKNSAGPLSLLKDGAMPYISAIEIMTHYKEIYKLPLKLPSHGHIALRSENNTIKDIAPIKIKKEIPDFLNSNQKKILELLYEKALQIDELSRLLEIPSYKLLAELTQLEILSLVTSLPGGIYKLFEMSVF